MTPVLGWELGSPWPYGGDFCSPAALAVWVSKGWCVQGVGGTRAGLRDKLALCFACSNVQGNGFDPEPARGLEGARWGALGFI